MKYINIIFIWLCAAFVTYMPVSILISYLEPIPSMSELVKVEGILKDYSIWRKKSGKGRRCNINLSIESDHAGMKQVRVSCNEKTESLEQRKGEYIEVWMKLHEWYHFEKYDYSVFHIQIEDDIFIDYEIKAPRHKSSKWLLLITLIGTSAFAVYMLMTAFKDTLRIWLGDELFFEKRNASVFSQKDCFLIKEKSDGKLDIKILKSIETKALLGGIFLIAGCCLAFSIFFLIYQTGGGIVMYLMGVLGVFVWFFSLNPRGYVIDKESKQITRKDYFCDPVEFEGLGTIEELQMYKYHYKDRGKRRTSYHLVAECSGGNMEIIGWKYLEPLATVQQRISGFLGIEMSKEIIEVDNIFQLKEGSSKHFGFLADLPGFILMGMLFFGVFFSFIF